MAASIQQCWALPLTVFSGAAVPYRTEIILITLTVILATLVFHGLSLAPLIRRLKPQHDASLEEEEVLVREQIATAALARLDELAQVHWPLTDHLDRLRLHYRRRLQRYRQVSPNDPDCCEVGAAAFRRLHDDP